MSSSVDLLNERLERKSEKQFLNEEMAAAKLAIRHTLLEVKDDALQAADPRYWVSKYPLPSLAVGFAVGLGLLYSRGQEDGAAEHGPGDSPGSGQYEQTEKKKSAGKIWVNRFGRLAKVGATALRYAVLPV